jgi:hypothetical protein
VSHEHVSTVAFNRHAIGVGPLVHCFLLDAIPIKIENAFQKNWVTNLAVNVRKVGSTFPQRNPR